jgi:hypothetical protein
MSKGKGPIVAEIASSPLLAALPSTEPMPVISVTLTYFLANGIVWMVIQSAFFWTEMAKRPVEHVAWAQSLSSDCVEQMVGTPHALKMWSCNPSGIWVF